MMMMMMVNDTKYNPRCYSGTEWSGGDDGDDGGDDDDDPNELQLDDDDDVFLPPGRNFPDKFLPAGELFSLCCFSSRRGGGIFPRWFPVY